MLTSKDLQLFESIARNNPQFREWLQRELNETTKVMINMVDEGQMRRAQGAAITLQKLIEALDLTLNPPRAPAR